MSETHEFLNTQRAHLAKIEASIKKTRTDLDATESEAIERVKAKREHAAAELQERQTKFGEAMSRMRARLDAKKQETAVAIEKHQQERNVQFLEDRAHWCEDYAKTVTFFLEDVQNEAHAASLEAVDARRLAEEAKQKV